MNYRELRDLVARKNLTWQKTDMPDRLEVFAWDGPERYDAIILKPSAISIGANMEAEAEDLSDFLANHDADANWPIGQKLASFATSDYEFTPESIGDTCPAGESKSVLYKITEDYRLNGGKFVTDGKAVFGDWVECQLVDHDNLLGYGVDVVVKNWVPKWRVDWKSCSDLIQTPYAGAPPVGFYLRLTYHSVGAEAVGFFVNLFLHRPI